MEMFNQRSSRWVAKSAFHEGRFVKPLYKNYCFSNILPATEAILTKGAAASLPDDVFIHGYKHYKNVVVILVDGLGWKMFEKACTRSIFLKRITRRAVVSQLTAQFPSTTAAAVTSLHTGLPAGEHGVYEWFYYEPRVDAVIAPLLFSLAGNKTRNALLEMGIRPEMIFPRTTFYKRLEKKRIQSSVFMPQEYLPSPYSNVLTKGARVFPYKTVAEGLTELSAALSRKAKPSYTFFYFDKIDSLAHKYGAASSYCEAEIDSFFFNLRRAFLSKYDTSDSTLILITADHGQIDIDPTKTVYLNEEVPILEKFLQKTKKGDPIVPVGGCRDMFLHVREEFLEEAQALLGMHLKSVAHIFRVSALAEEGFFGTAPRRSLLRERCGSLMIAPYHNHLVWWNKNKTFTITHKSHHGGLSEEEMFIPLVCLES